jgi:Ca-activated chloride channel family protein
MKWLAYPLALRLTALVPVLMVLGYVAWRKRRQAQARLGSVPAVQALTSARRGRRLLRGLCFFTGMSVLIAGVAGPQWGGDPGAETTAASGRDLVIVLDLSRSMLAEQPSRQERALRALRDLADTLQLHGGHRTALVIFAARPKLVFPLTNDYDHLRATLATLDADSLPADLRPHADENSISGTRIGAALRLAVATHDLRFQGAQDILLVSDGDDPAQDKEWRQGILAARDKKIPVHVVGVGDPLNASAIPFGNDVLRHDDTVVKTRLQEKPLEEIAQSTGGVYLPGQTKALPLGELFRTVIEPRGERATSEIESTADLPILRQRYAWFFGSALALLAMTMLIRDQRQRKSARLAAAGLWALPLALLLVSADRPHADLTVPRSPADDLVERGNNAFTNGDYATALKYYEQAEERIPDPGLVAFNKATALYHMERYREAELHYLRCLEDQNAPLLRKARGYYDVGNSLVKQAQADDAATLERAVDCYRECLTLAGSDAELRDAELTADARHNLELASLLWLRARAAAKRSPDNPDRPEEQKPNAETANAQENSGLSKGRAGEPGDKGTEKAGAEPGDQDGKKKQASAGKLLNLPDQDELIPLPPEDAVAFLDQAALRIRREHRDYHRLAVPPSSKVRDW